MAPSFLSSVQPRRRGFQAVIKSAVSAGPLLLKTREKQKKIAFYRDPYSMCGLVCRRMTKLCLDQRSTFPVQCRPCGVVLRGRRELSIVKFICDFQKFQTVCCKSIGFELPRGGGRTHGRTDGRTDGRRNNQLRAQPSEEMHKNKFK